MTWLSESLTNFSHFLINTVIFGFLAWNGTVKSLKASATYMMLDAMAGSLLLWLAFFSIIYLSEDPTPIMRNNL